jgi:hypothetical protein
MITLAQESGLVSREGRSLIELELNLAIELATPAPSNCADSVCTILPARAFAGEEGAFDTVPWSGQAR